MSDLPKLDSMANVLETIEIRRRGQSRLHGMLVHVTKEDAEEGPEILGWKLGRQLSAIGQFYGTQICKKHLGPPAYPIDLKEAASS